MSDSPETRKIAYRVEIPVLWCDMDAMGHVNNSVFFTYFEQARVAWLDTTGWRADRNSGPVAANAACTFLRPIVYPGVVEVRLFTGPPGRTSIPTLYEIRRTDDSAMLYARGEVTMVWVNRDSGRPVALPAGIRRLVEELPAAS
jgi:acyl-CoA thioester hydrolase